MAWSVTADVEKFDEAEAWFDSRFPITEELKDQLREYAGKRAWLLAGVTELDLVLEVFESIRAALRDGTPLAEWKREIRERIGERWGTKTSARLDVIFRTNVQTAYGRGRYVQMKDPVVVAVRPFWMFDAILDGRTTKLCQDRNKTILRQDDPWWSDNYPPIHHQCRSSVRSLTESQAKRRGISPSAPDADEPGGGFGKAPTADEWKPDPDKYPPELWRIFEDKQAEAAGE